MIGGQDVLPDRECLSVQLLRLIEIAHVLIHGRQTREILGYASMLVAHELSPESQRLPVPVSRLFVTPLALMCPCNVVQTSRHLFGFVSATFLKNRHRLLVQVFGGPIIAVLVRLDPSQII